jgi:hypothetical protein
MGSVFFNFNEVFVEKYKYSARLLAFVTILFAAYIANWVGAVAVVIVLLWIMLGCSWLMAQMDMQSTAIMYIMDGKLKATKEEIRTTVRHVGFLTQVRMFTLDAGAHGPLDPCQVYRLALFKIMDVAAEVHLLMLNSDASAKYIGMEFVRFPRALTWTESRSLLGRVSPLAYEVQNTEGERCRWVVVARKMNGTDWMCDPELSTLPFPEMRSSWHPQEDVRVWLHRCLEEK